MNNLRQDPSSGLILPRNFIDEKKALKKVIDDYVEKVCNEHSLIYGTYYLTLKARFDKFDPTVFNMDRPKITKKLPPFMANSFVFWICNKRSICELLWMVAPARKGEKLKVEFNKSGVAYLQAKGAMPS
jgi:hypothetical protein